MKKFSKILSVALLVALVLSLGVANAFAEAPTTGSITVNPNNDGQTYTLYKLFDANISFTEGTDEDGATTYTQAAITYQLPSGKSNFKANVNGTEVDGGQWFKLNSNGFVEQTDALTADVMKSQAFRDWAKAFGTADPDTKTATQDNDPAVKWEDVAFGYYLVDSTLGSFVGIDSANPDVVIQDKNNPPSLDKYITEVKTSEGASDGSIFAATDPAEIQFTGDGSNEHAIAQIGDTITYNIDITIKPGAQNYVLTDVLDTGLTAPSAENVAVTQGETNLKTGNKATVTVSTQTITVNFSQDYLNTIAADTVVKVSYTATLNANAVVATGSNDNTATLTWGHKPAPDSTYDQSKVWTAKVGVLKKIKDENGEPLKDAGFILKKGELFYKHDAATDVVTWVTEESSATILYTGEDGKLNPEFVGLANGTYTLIEKVVPVGYNKLDDTTVTIAEKDVTAPNLYQVKTVINNAGTTLPSTGGIGTTIFYVVGGVLVLAAIILLVTKKRMSE